MFKRPHHVSDLQWNQHLFACTMTCYNLTAIASNGTKLLLEMVLPICEKFVKRDFVEEYGCKTCDGMIGLSRKQVDWYMEKFGNLPKRCDGCRVK
jgi:hypothetical protein